MPARKGRERIKGRKSKGRFLSLPASVLDNPDYRALSGNSIKLLIAMFYQYRGNNNGDLNASFSVMKDWGFVSKDTLQKAKQQLLDHGLIHETRNGQFMNPGGVCSLYALTWLPVDECNGKLDIEATSTPLRKFSLENSKAVIKRN